MVGIIIQARMGAKRLPGKVLKEVDGVPLLKFQIERIKLVKNAQKIIVATTTSPQDDAILDFCTKNSIICFRGSENDVLTRYYECAKKYNLATVVRLTGDCPLADPVIIDKTINHFFSTNADFTGNTVPPETSSFPDGSDVEVFSFKALERAYHECKDPHFREHVTFYFWKNDNGFNLSQYREERNLSKYRLTVDYPEDLEVLSFLIKELHSRKQFGHLDEVISLLDQNSNVREKNSQYYFGIGWKQ